MAKRQTTVYLDEETRAALKRAAKSQGVSEARLIREALRRFLFKPKVPKLPVVVGCSQDGGVARVLDDALEEAGFGRVDR